VFWVVLSLVDQFGYNGGEEHLKVVPEVLVDAFESSVDLVFS